ncbi:unnamed protein product, partial [Mesorhabditis spiculigera]
MRSNLNMAMVCMLNSTVLAQERAQKFIMIGNVSHQVDDCPILEIGNRKPMEHRGTFDWSSQERAVLFAMFYVEKAHIDEGRKSNPHTEKPRWGVLLKSPLIWSLAACSLCHNFITVGTVTYLPLYYRTVLNMSLTSNGIFSALPFVAQFFSKVAFASFADEAKKRKWMSITAATKICNSMASFGIGFCFLGLCFFDCQLRGWAIAAVFGAMIFVSGYVPGYNTSVVCVAPSQTAAIASFTRFWGQVGSSVAPYMIGALAKTGTLDEWKHVFATIVFLCFSSGVFFQIVGSASIQDWDTSAQCTEMKLIEAKPEPEKLTETQNPEEVPLDDPKLQSTT